MRVRRGPIWALTATRHLIGERVAILLLIVAAISVITFSKIHEEKTARIMMAAMDVLAPAYEIVSSPVLSTNRVIADVTAFLNVYDENKRLKLEVERLRQWQGVALHLEQTNAVLSKQLNIKLEAQPSFVTARVIGDAIGPFVKTYVLNVGRRDGVAKGLPVLAGDSVIGRISTAGNRASRLLLLTDLNSRIPVIIENSRVRAILGGDNQDTAQLRFLPVDTKIELGDRIVTSGHGGVFPPGLPVGTISAIVGRDIRIQPMVDLSRIEFATVLQSFDNAMGYLDDPLLAIGAAGL